MFYSYIKYDYCHKVSHWRIRRYASGDHNHKQEKGTNYHRFNIYEIVSHFKDMHYNECHTRRNFPVYVQFILSLLVQNNKSYFEYIFTLITNE